MTNSNPTTRDEPDEIDGRDAELRALMQGGSKTFFAASLLLPARVRGPATALYAFCRLADDAIDFGVDKDAAGRELRRRLDAVYRGEPESVPADRALATVVRRFGIPRALLDGLLEDGDFERALDRFQLLGFFHDPVDERGHLPVAIRE